MEVRMKKAFSDGYFFIIAVFMVNLLFLTSCSKKDPELILTNHRMTDPEGIIYITAGDSIKMDPAQLSNIPEGHDAKEYEWSSTYVACDVQSDGTVTGKKGGNCTVYARLLLKDVQYTETFDIIVRPQRQVFTLEPTELSLVVDDNGLFDIQEAGSHNLELTLDEPLVYQESIDWISSDPAVVYVNGSSNGNDRGRGGTKAAVHGKGEGSAEITASAGNLSAAVHVTVRQNYAGPGQILEVLSRRAEENTLTAGNTVFVSSDDIGCTMTPEGEPGGGGKYLVQVEQNMKGMTVDASGAEPSEPITYRIGYTSLLPKEMRAESMADVSYFIRVREVEPSMGPLYTNSGRGWYRKVEIQLVDALTDEVLETYESLHGSLEDEYHLPEGTKNIYSPLPDESRINASLRKTLASFWLETCDSIVFYDHTGKGEKVNGKPGPEGIRAYACYGKGTVQFPEELGFTVLAPHDKGDITGFDLSANMELNNGDWWGWKENFLIRAPEGSETEKFLQKHGIPYEAVK